jgi:TonB family protein
LAGIVAGCTKKGYISSYNKVVPITERAKLLTAYHWKEATIIVHQIKDADTVTNNVTNQFASIDRDDLTTLNEDGTFIFEEGATKFKPMSAQRYQKGTWQLDSSEKILSLTFNNSTDHYTILALDSTRLVVRLSVESDDSTYAYIITHIPEPKREQAFHSTRPVNTVYTNVDQLPEFPGGMHRLFKLINKHHTYPREARKNGIEGKVVIQFIIHEDGTPGNFEIIESLGYGCDEAALKAFQSMPAWKPGTHNGQAVKVKMQSAYLYQLQ